MSARRIAVLVLAAVMATSFSGCNREICDDRTLFGFLICSPDDVTEGTRPDATIKVHGDSFHSEQKEMYAGETFVASSVSEGDPFLPSDYIAQEEWDIDGEAGYEQRFPYAGSSVTRLVADPQLLTIRLRATDQEGNVGFDDYRFHVIPRGTAEDPPPGISVFANPNPARVGEVVRFSAGTTNALHNRVAWDLDGAPGFEQPGHAVNAKFWRKGEYTIRARVRDDAGREAEHSVVVVVQGAHAGETIPPIARFSVRPNPAMVDEPVYFDGTGSGDEDGNLIRWEWDVFPQPGIDIDSPSAPSVSASYSERPADGVQRLYLRVTDDDGETDDLERFLQLDPPGTYSPPVANLTVTPNPADVGQPITLDASGSTDADGSVVRYEWDLDGSTRSIASAEYEVDGGATSSIVHSYSTHPGYGILVGVRVTDDDGREDTFHASMHVRPGSDTLASRPRAVVAPAARSTTTRLFARLDRLRLVSAGRPARVRGGTLLRGLRLRGGIAGKLLKPNGEEATSSPRVLGQLLRGRWSTRLDLRNRGGRDTVSGLALAQTTGRRPARACLRLTLRTGTPKDGRTPITGSFRVLGGDRAAARLRATGRFGLEIRPKGYAVAAGTVTSAAGSARKLPAACRRLARSR